MNKRAFHVYTLAAKQPRAPQHANIGVAPNHFAKILVFGLALLILACLNKFILGTGQNFSAGQIMQQSSADIYFARMSSFAILLMSIVLANITGVSRTAIRTSALFWLPLILFLWLRLPILEGDGPVLLRTLNFYAVIIAMSLLACNKENSNLFLKYLYYIMAIANSIGLVLFTAKIPFSYFSDGYGMMFTGVFPQKDILSTTAALGAILAISRITSGYKCIDIGIFCLQIITLFCAATLSSLGAFIFGFFAIFRPVLLLGLTGAFAILLPFTHFFFASIATMLGKDPTFTGRTRLWEFTLEEALQSPLFGHGFRHVSATIDWMQMLQSEFRSDSFFIPHAHNLWIDAFYKFGIFGTTILALIMILIPMIFIRPSPLFDPNRICYALLSFWLFKSALTVPFLSSDTTSYIWAFCLSFCVICTQDRSENPKS